MYLVDFKIYSLLFYVLTLLSLSSPAQVQCRDLLFNVKSNFIQSQAAEKNFSARDFYAFKSKYIAVLESGEKIKVENLTSIEQKLAFFEAISIQNKLDFLSWVQMEKRNIQQQDMFYKLISEINFSNPVRSNDLENFLKNLYKVSNQWSPFWKKLIGPSSEDILNRRIQISLAKEELSDVLEDLNIIQDQKVLAWIKQKYKGWGRLALSASLSLVTTSLFGVPTVLKTRFTESVGLSHLDMASSVDSMVLRAQRIIYAVVISFAIKSALPLIHIDFKELASESKTIYNVSKTVMLESFGKESIDSELLKSSYDTEIFRLWKLQFQEIHNREADPEHNLFDRYMWIEYLQSLLKSVTNH